MVRVCNVVMPLLVLLVLGTLGCEPDVEDRASDEAEVRDEEDQVDLEDDPFAVGATLRRIDELGVPTPALVDELEASAYGLLASEGCELAIDALEEFGRRANWLANLIAGAWSHFTAPL
jgi:hypothetical protein